MEVARVSCEWIYGVPGEFPWAIDRAIPIKSKPFAKLKLKEALLKVWQDALKGIYQSK
jgi:hypothetical protein